MISNRTGKWATERPAPFNRAWLRGSASRRQWEMDPKPTSCPDSKDRPTPKRRGRIVIRRKRAGSPAARSSGPGPGVISDLPTAMPVLREEVAILRAYLAREIDAILVEER